MYKEQMIIYCSHHSGFLRFCSGHIRHSITGASHHSPLVTGPSVVFTHSQSVGFVVVSITLACVNLRIHTIVMRLTRPLNAGAHERHFSIMNLFFLHLHLVLRADGGIFDICRHRQGLYTRVMLH